MAPLGQFPALHGRGKKLPGSHFRSQYGLADYLLVIDAERTLLANRLLLAQAINLQMGASVHLIKALGGGWEGLEQPNAPSTSRDADTNAVESRSET